MSSIQDNFRGVCDLICYDLQTRIPLCPNPMGLGDQCCKNSWFYGNRNMSKLTVPGIFYSVKIIITFGRQGVLGKGKIVNRPCQLGVISVKTKFFSGVYHLLVYELVTPLHTHPQRVFLILEFTFLLSRTT